MLLYCYYNYNYYRAGAGRVGKVWGCGGVVVVGDVGVDVVASDGDCGVFVTCSTGIQFTLLHTVHH